MQFIIDLTSLYDVYVLIAGISKVLNVIIAFVLFFYKKKTNFKIL